MELRTALQSLGHKILAEGTHPTWFVGQIDSGEGHTGGSLNYLYIQQFDGSVVEYGEVEASITPEQIDETYNCRTYSSVGAFYEEAQGAVVDEILDLEPPEFNRTNLILFMMSQGWEPIMNTGRVRHGNDHRTFASWYDAIKACIESASETRA